MEHKEEMLQQVDWESKKEKDLFFPGPFTMMTRYYPDAS